MLTQGHTYYIHYEFGKRREKKGEGKRKGDGRGREMGEGGGRWEGEEEGERGGEKKGEETTRSLQNVCRFGSFGDEEEGGEGRGITDGK